MELNDTFSHDLKTERPGLTGGLPSSYRVVPLLFYLTLVGAFGLSVFYYLEHRRLADEQDRWTAYTADQNARKSQLRREISDVEIENKRAGQVVEWVDTAQGVQPLAVAIAKSVDIGATIDTLHLERDPEIPAQIHLTLKLNGDVHEQLDATMQAVRMQRYRSFSAEQTQKENLLDYSCRLIWMGKNELSN